MNGRPESPLTTREERIIEANQTIGDDCPNPECDKTPRVADLSDDGTLYITHHEDGVGLESNSPRGETDGCRVPAEHDPTV